MDDLRSSELAAIDVTHLAGDKEATLKFLRSDDDDNKSPKDLFTLLDVFSATEIQEGLILEIGRAHV